MQQKKKKQIPQSDSAGDWFPRSASVIGAGRSGIAAARILAQGGCDVFISDTCDEKKLDYILASNNLAHLKHEAGGHSAALLSSEVIILSPGVRSDLPVLQAARDKGVPIWSEIELAFRLSTAPFAAVTGSSGKSTTVSLLGSIFTAAGREHVVAGNIGSPLCACAPQVSSRGVVVAEVSSFQLETIDRFKPRAAAVLNLMKNHLDRYASEEEYDAAKKAIARNMDMGCVLVLNARDEKLLTWSRSVQERTKVVFFGRETESGDCVWHDCSALFMRTAGSVRTVIDVDAMAIRGPHNWNNACAAAAMAAVLGVDIPAIAGGLARFRGLPHRLEFVGEVDKVKYYNDSKATTAESVACAVQAFDANVHLICGGRDKGCDFAGIRDIIARRVKSVHCIGEAAGRIAIEWDGATELTREDSLEAAFAAARSAAAEGDVVLLSPGCSSFDMFSSFEQRGDVFKALVGALTPKGNEHRE